ALLVFLALGAGSCRTTPLDNVWPGCKPAAPPCPPPTTLAPSVAPARFPASVVIDERISPAVDCNPVRTQHTLVVTVLDSCGNPLPGQRVEWVLTRYPEAVGDIVAVDDQYGSGVIAPLTSSRVTNAGNKITNLYAVSVTNYGPEMIDAGNNHPYVGQNGARLPDITVGTGQSWITITSTREGVTDLFVYVPAIRDGTKHKIFAKKIWADYDVVFPESAVNVLPAQDHAFPVQMVRSDGTGIPGQPVEAEILDGPEAVFSESNASLAEVLTNANGIAEFHVQNVAGESGVNRLRFTANGTFYGEVCPRSAIVTKTWRRVALEISCDFPGGPEAFVGKPFEKMITVTNTGDATAENVVLDDRPDGGLSFAGGASFPLEIGSLAPGESRTETVTLLAQAPGPYVNTVIATSSVGDARAEATCPVEVVQGVLELTKVCEPDRVNAGGEVRFVVTVTNSGRGPLENVVVLDEYPEGIEPTSQDRVTLGTLQPGEVQEIQFTGVADVPGTFTNRARATADGVPEKEATCTLRVVACNLKMELVGPGKVYYNEPANFTIRVRNEGDGDAAGCMVRVIAGECLGNVVRDFNVGPLGPGEEWVQDLAVTGTGVGSCLVTAESDCGARCQARQDVTLRVTGLPALQVEMVDKALDGTEAGVFRVGETFLYRVTVMNDIGTEATPGMIVTWRLPPELEFVSGRSDRQATVSGAGIQASSTPFALGLRETITFDLQVRVLSAPPSGMVKTDAVVTRASDGVELSRETESTTLRP
ncbi:MAG: COG1361 S-layer family protein, partial [Planctomycetota bacterium]